jgi:ElaB/YqjD/DUF883 family membrane-anchored ribosome-binding protein
MVDTTYDDRSRAPANGGMVTQVASGAAEAAGSAASDTATTAKEQAGQVANEAKAQARNLASQTRDRLSTEVNGQNDRLVSGLRRFVDELEQMVEDRDDSPARGVVTQVSQGGRRVADYLEQHGPEGALREVQDFARRKPGTFLAVAAVSGFVAGRLGKSVLSGSTSDSGASSAPAAPPVPGTSAWATPAAVPLTEPGVVSSTTYATSTADVAYGDPLVPVPVESTTAILPDRDPRDLRP